MQIDNVPSFKLGMCFFQTKKGVMDEMMGGYPDPPIKAPIHPRAMTGEAAENAEANKGGGMRSLMANYGNLDIDDDNNQPPPKVMGDEASEYDCKVRRGYVLLIQGLK